MSDHSEEDYEGGDAACHDIVAKLEAENKALREENQDLRLQLITALVPDGYDRKTWESWLGKISQKKI